MTGFLFELIQLTVEEIEMEGMMKLQKLLKKSLSIFVILMLMLSTVGTVFAEDGVTPEETPEPEPTGENQPLEEVIGAEVTAEPTLDQPDPEPEEPPAENQPLEEVVGAEVTAEPVLVEFPEEELVEEPVGEVVVAEVVVAAAENKVVLADAEGEPLDLASEESAEAIEEVSDPWYCDSTTCYGWSITGVCAASVPAANCTTSANPINDAIAAAPAGSTIYIVPDANYEDDIVNVDKDIVLEGSGGVVTIGTVNLYESISAWSDVFALTVNVMDDDDGILQDAVDIVKSGGNVNVNKANGTYKENVTVSKPMTITGDIDSLLFPGPGPNAPTLYSMTNSGTGFNILANGVTIRGWLFHGFDYGVDVNDSINTQIYKNAFVELPCNPSPGQVIKSDPGSSYIEAMNVELYGDAYCAVLMKYGCTPHTCPHYPNCSHCYSFCDCCDKGIGCDGCADWGGEDWEGRGWDWDWEWDWDWDKRPTPTPTPGDEPEEEPIGVLLGTNIITAGLAHTCALTPDRGLICWGLNDSGQLGNGTFEDSRVSVNVIDISSAGIIDLVSGTKHTCALLNNGNVYCWGLNSSGQLGVDNTENSSSPVLVQGLPANVASITAGAEFTCAVDGGNQVWCWGNNQDGQLNDGTTESKTLPVMSEKVGTEIVMISGGQNNLQSVSLDGSVELLSAQPIIPVTGLPEENNIFVAADRFAEGGCSLTRNGTAKCWGGIIDSEITGISASKKISAGKEHACGINSEDGHLVCWGGNNFGQLGDGTGENQTEPVAVLGLNGNIIDYAAGEFHTCAILGKLNQEDADQVIKCWGKNDFGQLGNNSVADSDVPVIVQ